MAVQFAVVAETLIIVSAGFQIVSVLFVAAELVAVRANANGVEPFWRPLYRGTRDRLADLRIWLRSRLHGGKVVRAKVDLSGRGTMSSSGTAKLTVGAPPLPPGATESERIHRLEDLVKKQGEELTAFRGDFLERLATVAREADQKVEALKESIQVADSKRRAEVGWSVIRQGIAAGMLLVGIVLAILAAMIAPG